MPAQFKRLALSAGVNSISALDTVWSLEVVDNAGHLPSDGYLNSDGFCRKGIDLHQGYMPLPEAVDVIAKCLREYDSLWQNKAED